MHVGLVQVLLIRSVMYPIGSASTRRLAKVVKLENFSGSSSNRYDRYAPRAFPANRVAAATLWALRRESVQTALALQKLGANATA